MCIRDSSRSEPLSGRAELLVRAQYDALVLILGGDERDWATWSQRFFRVGLLVLSVVVLSTYTARRRARASPLIVHDASYRRRRISRLS